MTDPVRIRARLDRVALIVDDIDIATRYLAEVLGMQPTPCEASGASRAVRTSHGYELVEPLPGEPPQHWSPPLASLVLAVDQIDVVRDRLLAAGAAIVSDATVDGAREISFGRTFLDIPLVVRAMPAD